MFTTGSKLHYGAALTATVGAVLYGLIDGGAIGTVGLTFAAVALFFLGGIVQFTRDANVSAMDVEALHRSAAAAPAPSRSMWPAVAALAGVLLVVGLVTDQVVFVLGVIVAVAAGFEWMVQAWSDRASADQGHNAAVRSRTAHPLEFPILAAVGVGVIVFSFSRIMLFLTKAGGPAAFAIIAALLLAIGFVFAARPTLKGGAIGAVAAIGALGLIAGGIASAMGGEREMHVYETTGMLAAESECDTTEETEADEGASQTVAGKANVTGTVTLHDNGTLTATALGLPEPSDSISIIRNNPTNVVFRNESDEARRLVLNAGHALRGPL